MAIDNNDSNDTLVYPGQSGNTPLQITRWTGQRESVTSSGTAQRITLPNAPKLIEIAAQEAAYLNFGDVTVVATSTIADDVSRLFLAGVQVVPVPLDPATGDPYTHVSVLQVSTAGIVQVEELA